MVIASVTMCKKKTDNRVLSKVDHFGIDVRILLEQNKFSEKVTSNRD